MNGLTITPPANQPTIMINGVVCTPSEVIMLQAAVLCVAEEMRKPDPIGKDEHGKKVAEHFRLSLLALHLKLFP